MYSREIGKNSALVGKKSDQLDYSVSNLAQCYQTQGFVRLPQLLSTDICQEMCEKLLDWAGPNPQITTYGILGHNIWQKLDIFQQSLFSSSIPSFAAHLLEAEEVLLFQDNIIWKPPHLPQHITWHQDYAYWPLDRPTGITIWIALEDVDDENGCMRFIPGSHQWGECQRTSFDPTEQISPDLPPLPWKEHESKELKMHCQQGYALAHHPLNCHMSPPNRSNRHRRAWSLSFVSTDICWAPAHSPHPFNYYLQPVAGECISSPNNPNFPRFRKEELPCI